MKRLLAYLAAAATATLYFVAASLFASGADWLTGRPGGEAAMAVWRAAAAGAVWAFLAFIPAEWILDRRPQWRARLFWPVAAAFASVAASRALMRLAQPASSFVALWLAAVPDGLLVLFAFLLFDFTDGWYASLLGCDTGRE